MPSYLTIWISTPASSYFLRNALNGSIVWESRHFWTASATAVCSAFCSGVSGVRAAPRPAPRGGVQGAGALRYASTGCRRSSAALRLSWIMSERMSSAPPGMLWKLYGTLMPTCTPPKTELGLAAQMRPAGNATRASLPMRSEEHTSELQSLRHLVCRLLLEKNTHTGVLATEPTWPHLSCCVARSDPRT